MRPALLRDLKVNIIQRLIPKLQKEDYFEEVEAEANARAERRHMEAQNPNHSQGISAPQNLPFPGYLPQAARPRPPPAGDFPPPDFEDEHQMNRPPPSMLPGRSPYNIGHDDLNPPGLGPHDPLRSSFTGGGLPRPGGGGGMHPTFDDPLFNGQGSAYPRGQGQGYDPQAPPGARWDPVGPGMGHGPRFPNHFGGGGGSGGNPFGGAGGGGII